VLLSRIAGFARERSRNPRAWGINDNRDVRPHVLRNSGRLDSAEKRGADDEYGSNQPH